MGNDMERFINTTQNMRRGAGFSGNNVDKGLGIREKYYENVEQMLRVFNGPNIVEIARQATKEKNKGALEKYPILGHIINPVRQTIDPVTTALFSDWPRFHHDYKIKGILREPDIEPDEYNINTLKISPFDIGNSRGLSQAMMTIPSINFIGCSTNTKLEIQLTYQALAIVGLPDVKVFLYKRDQSVFLTQKERMRRSKGYKNQTISDEEFAEQDQDHKKYIGKAITDEFGYASFDVSCDKTYSGARMEFSIRALMDDPEGNIEKLYSSYEPLQHEIGKHLQKLWEENKPLWDKYDFSKKRTRDWGNLAIGAKGAFDNFFSPIFPYEKHTTKLISEVWNNIYGSGNEGIIQEIEEAKKSAQKLKNIHEFKQVLKKENIDEKTLFSKLDDMYRTYSLITKFIADEVLVYFVTKSLLATVRCICDDEFQMIVYHMTGKVLTGIVISTIVKLIAKYVLKVPKIILDIIFWYGMYNITSTVKETIAKSYKLSQAVTPLEDLFLEHFFQNKDLNILVKTHRQQYNVNSNNILGTEEWTVIDTSANSKTVNSNVSNALA